MGRPRAYDVSAVVEAARDLFWERGYELSSVGELEERTGLNRSSLYQAFGSKRDLFGAALRCYIQQETEPTLSGMRQPGAGLEAVAGFFEARAQAFRSDPELAARGCLMINTIAEFGTRDRTVAQAAAAHRERLHHAFSTALGRAAARGELDTGDVAPRASLLVSAAMGVFLTAKTDPGAAAEACEAIAADVSSWHPA
jgi:TetR/AcrR family transcriptional regulator, transcriptional repressor for nem operon